MTEEKLPETYQGFSTAELLQYWDSIPDRHFHSPDPPEGLTTAMNNLLEEYKIMDLYDPDDDLRAVKIRRSKRLLAPYSIDPAPWADENGYDLPSEIRDALAIEDSKKEAERLERNSTIYSYFKLKQFDTETDEDEE